MIVWMMEQKLRCPDCGTREDEWNPDKGGKFHAYHISPYICHYCARIEETYEDKRKENKHHRLPAGFKVRLVPDFIWQQRKHLREKIERARRKEPPPDSTGEMAE